jgi:mono/diheme cytochrome c family protein
MTLPRLILFLLLVLSFAALGAAWVISMPRPAFADNSNAVLNEPGDPSRGRDIFNAADCSSCHASRGQPDRLRLGGGLALASPMGTFHVPNISPDPVDGIGAWQTVDLANAIMSGVSPDRRHYYPVLPYTSYVRMRPEDVRDLMAYLRTLPPVQGKPPPHELPFPLNIRRTIGFWKLLFFDRSAMSQDAAHDAEWNRGRYLVEAVGHCAECHSTHNLLGAVEKTTRFAGGPDIGGVGFVPNITPGRIGGWSKQDMAEMLRTGMTPDLRKVGSTMYGVVQNTALLSSEDRDAIAIYIKTLAPQPMPSGYEDVPY